MKNIRKFGLKLALAVTLIAAGSVQADDEVQVRGRLNAINSSSVTVASTTCALNGSTEYRDADENSIPRTAFSVGEQVKLRCHHSVATRLEKEEGGSSSSSSSNSSKSSSSSESSESSSSSDSSNSSGSDSEKEFKDSLSAVDGVSTNSVGKAKFQSSRNDNGTKELRFNANVKIPIPNTTPPASTIDEASARNLSVALLRSGVAYAQCTFVFDHVSALNGSPAAEYRVDVRKEGRKLRERKGQCDTDLTLDGIQSGVPVTRKGDTALVEDASAGVFLEGTLKRS